MATTEPERVQPINCQTCGGTLAFEPGQTLVRCDYCQGLNLIIVQGDIPTYHFPARISAREAQIRAEDALYTTFSKAADLETKISFEKPQLYYIPYYEISGVRYGTALEKTISMKEAGKLQERAKRLSLLLDGRLSYHQVRNFLGGDSVKDKLDTRVIINDLAISNLAASIPDWGLENIKISKIRRDKEYGFLEPVSIRKLQKSASVIHPSQPLDHFLSNSLMTSAAEDSSNIRLFDRDICLIYYPVWRIVYTYHGTPYQVTVDGLTGNRLFARIPQSETFRITLFLTSIGFLGFTVGVAGGLLGSLVSLVELMIKYSIFTILLTLTYGVFLAALVSFGWVHLRYPTEIILNGEHKDIRFIGKTGKSLPEKILEKLTMIYRT